ncbi:MAG: hypothetical protein RLZZ253_2999 [Verrucomicrobiota bacterium]
MVSGPQTRGLLCGVLVGLDVEIQNARSTFSLGKWDNTEWERNRTRGRG